LVAGGGVLVHAHLRGGGEFGRDWWEGGRQRNKANCYADLYAVAEDLISRGITTRGQLALTGVSNGGVLCGVAVTQRPDLWQAVVPQVPLLDLIGALRDPYDAYAISSEFADPEVPAEIRRLASFSPYHLVRKGVGYPAVFIVAGDNDPRCPAWHSRKFAARLQAAQEGTAPVLLHVFENAGHGAATHQEVALQQASEWLAFLFMTLGLSPDGPYPGQTRTASTTGV
jgi:prolyl oligopeptidase